MAKKVFKYKGIEWDSKLEASHYEFLLSRDDVSNIQLQVPFELQERFEYFNIETNKKARFQNMIYTVDFVVDVDGLDKPLAIESKGFARDSYMMRKKLFINKYHEDYYFIEVKDIKKLEKVLDRISSVKS